MEGFKTFLLYIFDIQWILDMDPLKASLVFGIMMGVMQGIAHIGMSLESKSKVSRAVKFIIKWFIYGLMVLHLMQWLLQHTFTPRGGFKYLLIAVAVWLGVTVLFYFPVIRKYIMKLNPGTRVGAVKWKRSPLCKNAVKIFKENKMKAIAVDPKGVYFYDYITKTACKDQMQVAEYFTFDKVEIKKPVPYVSSLTWASEVGQPECAALAKAIAGKLHMKSYMHVITTEGFEATSGYDTPVKYQLINGNLTHTGGHVNGSYNRTEDLIYCYYYVAPHGAKKKAEE